MAMPDDPHDQAEELLPWYVTGQLDAADTELFERHLTACARCQRTLGLEPALIGQIRAFAPDLESGWARLRSRIEARPARRSRITLAAGELWDFLRRPVVAAVAGAQVAFLAAGAWLLQPLSQPAFVALGSSQVAAGANIIVMFKPDAREADLRAALAASGASLVGGPTDADAYLLHVPAGARPSALAKLGADRNVTLAQPIDGPAQ
jgi:anti-sigma factor RsiW